MIKELLRGSKQHFLDKFQKSSYLPVIQKFKDGKLVLAVMTEEELKSREQNSAFHSLIGELYKSGMSSFNDYNECRDYFKNLGGLVSYEKQEVHPLIRNIERKVYSTFTQEDVKKLYAEHINNGQKTIRSVSDATRDEMILMINEVVNYCYDVGLNTDKFNEIMKGMKNE